MILIALALASLAAQRTLRYLQYFQQEGYERSRFLKWVMRHSMFERRGTVLTLVVLALLYVGYSPLAIGIAYAVAVFTLSFLEGNPTKKGKLPLNLTARAKRILSLSISISLVIISACYFLIESNVGFVFSQVIHLQILPFVLVFASTLLIPDEQRRTNWYIQEAKQILNNVDPFVIGITGSYGKTSTKDALSRILDITLAPTFWPEKGVNALMGITREVRNKLLPGHKYAVVEMGAYYRGSIKRLCDFTPPKAAILTSIGTAHLERFGSQEVIYKTKCELAAAVPYNGILVCNGDNPFTRKAAKEHRKETTLLYGHKPDPELDTWIKQWSLVENKTRFTLIHQGKTYHSTTPLIGETALLNAAGAFTMACALGSDPEYVLAVIATLKPVDQRLQIETAHGVTYLKNGYSSNPTGFRASLDLLAKLPVNRRIIMTPGIIELGTEQYLHNRKAASEAAQVADIFIVVGSTNEKALVDGFTEGNKQKQLYRCATRDEAFALFRSIQKQGDALLIESDLPDIYEGIQKL